MLPQLILFFVLGTSIGSFLNVVVDRNINKESIISGKSHCDKCRKNIAWYDLIPLISFVFLQGRCRYCKTKLSWYYPIVEFITGFLFVLVSIIFFQTGNLSANLFYYLILGSSFIVIFFSDLKYGIIPDKIIYPAIAISLVFDIFLGPLPFTNYLLSTACSFLFFFLIILTTKGRGMGVGDLKLAILLGLFLGFPKIFFALYMAFLTGAVVGIILILWRKKKLRGSTIPFGPFLILGTFISLFFTDIFVKFLFSGLF